ncbi:putative Glycerophosphoryl diester phosphodiesterase family protein [Blattamonas nauphoetae]|uniref:Glycerophosphoryl diester phosphodiesterase family protein n=1 Tax=Blattamonas nauphoetae TaxID=2049346 RepID=A0ABQ9YCQ4_9EUKA|nr:putative Glycerophosphoryl diester phosphodiesterase family protein [Blattamonas nauphoetae]
MLTMSLIFVFIVCGVASKRTLVVGHRGNGCSQPGCESAIPENTVESYLSAIEMGADVIEIDVWLSADNEIVITHRDKWADNERLYPSIVTMNNDTIPTPSDYSHRDRSRFPVKAAWSRDRPDPNMYLSQQYSTPHTPLTTIPLLREALQAVCPTGKKLVVELKADREDIGRLVMTEIEKYASFDCIHAISSFYWSKHQVLGGYHFDLLKPLKDDPRVKRALLIQVPHPDGVTSFIKAAKYYNASYLHPSCRMMNRWTEAMMQEVHQAGLEVMCYFGSQSMDKEADFVKAINKGVDEICTNSPKRLRNLIDKL